MCIAQIFTFQDTALVWLKETSSAMGGGYQPIIQCDLSWLSMQIMLKNTLQKSLQFQCNKLVKTKIIYIYILISPVI